MRKIHHHCKVAIYSRMLIDFVILESLMTLVTKLDRIYSHGHTLLRNLVWWAFLTPLLLKTNLSHCGGGRVPASSTSVIDISNRRPSDLGRDHAGLHLGSQRHYLFSMHSNIWLRLVNSALFVDLSMLHKRRELEVDVSMPR